MKRIVSFLLAVIMIVGMIPVTTFAAGSELKTSNQAIDILVQFEGFQEKAYQVGGKWYIGYGTEIEAGSYPNGITKSDAKTLLKAHIHDTVDKAINAFTKTNNLTLKQNQHDALAIFCADFGTAWLNGSGVLRAAVLQGKTGNAFINAIAQSHGADLSTINPDVDTYKQQVRGLLNRRLAEANMYLNNQYGYDAPSNYTFVVLDTDADGDVDKILAYNSKTSPAIADLFANPTMAGKEFLGWYYTKTVKKNGVETIQKIPVDTLDSSTAKLKLTAKFAGDSEAYEAIYTVGTNTLISRNIFHVFYEDTGDNFLDNIAESRKGTLKKNANFFVKQERMVDGTKWLFGRGKGTEKGKSKEVWLEGWVYGGKVAEGESSSANIKATATATTTVTIREGASAGSANLGSVAKGETVNIYAYKTEATDTGNKTWGKVDVHGVVGWVNLAYFDVDTDVKGDNVGYIGATGKVVNCQNVNVRRNAGVNEDLITVLPKGTKVTLKDTKVVDNALWGLVEWAKMRDGRTEGWVYMHYIELEGYEHSDIVSGNTGTVVTTDKILYTGVVTSNINLNVREEPDVYADKVGSLKTGTKVNIYETETARGMKWGRIGKDQWVCLSYVSLTKVNNTVANTDVTTENQGTVNVTTLDVYQNYNANSEKLGTLSKGAVVTILEKNTENTETGSRIWGRIKSGKLEGWINLAYVDLKTVTVVTGNAIGSTNTNAGTANTNIPAVISNCISVNVREDAGVYSNSITKLNNGTGVTVLKQVTHDGAPWAKISWNNGEKTGWACMYYITLNATGTTSNGASGTVGNTNSNTISATGYVNSNINLKVRAGAGLGYAEIGSLAKGTKVTIYEQVAGDGMVWGRMTYGNGSGWVCMSYITVESATTSGKGVMGTVARCAVAANVRSAPGTGNAKVGTVQVGSRVEVFEQRLYSNQYWGRIATGWVCMDYILLDGDLPVGTVLDATVPTTQATQATQAPQETINKDNEVAYVIEGDISTGDGSDLFVRNDATADSDKIGTIKDGLPLTILAVKNNGAELWGRVDQYATAGWVNLKYVNYKVKGYVNTDEQSIFASADTGSSVKGKLNVNTYLEIDKLTLSGSTVFGWVEITVNGSDIAGWIPMGRISKNKISVIPVYKSATDSFGADDKTTGTTNVALEAVDVINGSKVVFKLNAGVKVPIGEIKYEYGTIWGKAIANGVIGWIDMSGLTYVVNGVVQADSLNVRTSKYTGTEDNILGNLGAAGSGISVCELSFDGDGNLWGKLTNWAGDPAMNGGYLVIRNSAGAVRVSGIIG